MKINKYSDIGKRANQEDAFGCEQNVFVVCDGVGGHTKGEVASNFVVSAILKSIKNIEDSNSLNEISIQEIVKQAQIFLGGLLINSPESEGMGTTFCGVYKTDKAMYIAHIGDSRVYYIKPKEQLFWHTWDHSIVGYLVETGEITREEGRFHPQNNRISRAIIATKNQKIAKADISKITNVEKGDLFFICSDGVNESWSDLDLVKLLVSDKSIHEKLKIIQKNCVLESKDNNTAILLEIEEKDIIKGQTNELKMLSINDLVIDNKKYLENNNQTEMEHTIE